MVYDNFNVRCHVQHKQNHYMCVWFHMAFLNFTGSPKIFIIPQDVTALEGDTVSFDCLVTGQPPPEQTWLFEDIPVTAFDLPQFTIGEEEFGSLKIYNISYEDEGMYTCIYNSSIGEIVRSAQLSVQGTVCVVLYITIIQACMNT